MDPPSPRRSDPVITDATISKAQIEKALIWVLNRDMALQFHIVSYMLRPDFQPTSPYKSLNDRYNGVTWLKYPPPLLRMHHAEMQFLKSIKIFTVLWNHPGFRPIVEDPGFRRYLYSEWLAQPWLGLEGTMEPGLAWQSPDGNDADIPPPRIRPTTRHNPVRYRPEGKRLKKTSESRLTYKVLNANWFPFFASTIFFNDYMRWVFMSTYRFHRVIWNSGTGRDEMLLAQYVSRVATNYRNQDWRNFNTSDAWINLGNNWARLAPSENKEVFQTYHTMAIQNGLITPGMELRASHKWKISLEPDGYSDFPGSDLTDPHVAVLAQASSRTVILRVPSIKWAIFPIHHPEYMDNVYGKSKTQINLHQSIARHNYLIFDSPVTIIAKDVKDRNHDDLIWNVNIGLPSIGTYAHQNIFFDVLTLAHPGDLSRACQRVLNHAVMSRFRNGAWQRKGSFKLGMCATFYGPRNTLPIITPTPMTHRRKLQTPTTGHIIDNRVGILTIDLNQRSAGPLQMDTVSIWIGPKMDIVPLYKTMISQVRLIHVPGHPKVKAFVFKREFDHDKGVAVLKPKYADQGDDDYDDVSMKIGARRSNEKLF